MSAALYVDTGGWFALQVPDDRWHSAAAASFKDAVGRRARVITSNHVVGETYTLLRITRGHGAAWRFVETLGRSALTEVVRVDAPAEDDAWNLLGRYRDQAFSYVDATSFAVMKRHQLRHALAFDVHFATAGFTRVPIDGELP